MKPVQQDFPFIDQDKLAEYMPKHIALEEEMDLLKQAMTDLRKQYEPHLPMKKLLKAIRRVRIMLKLEQHDTDPFPRQHQAALEDMVERHMQAPVLEEGED